MRNKKYISILLNGIFVLTILLFALDAFTLFEIKSQVIKSCTYKGIMIFAPLVLIWNLWVFRTTKWRIIYSTVPTLFLMGVLIIGPFKISSAASAWRTQRVIYQNGHWGFKRIEYQMQDVGALGYNKRTVEVTYITNLFMIIHPVEIDIDDNIQWIKIDKEVNELGLELK